MRSILQILCLLCVGPVMAGHLLGGDMTYTHLGNNLYRVEVQVFKECGVGADLDEQISIGIFRQNGTHFITLYPILEPIINVPVESSNPCVVTPPDLCVQRGHYQAEVELPPGNGYYTLTYQRCCRGTPIANVNLPAQQGSTFTIQVPDAAVHGHNSSPSFDGYPDIVLCISFENEILQPATDADGDSIAYELAVPFHGGSNFDPVPFPEPPPYALIPLAPGYTVGNLLNTTPPLVIDPVTGTMTVTPTMQNRFVIGVRIKEYRNGVVISEVLRDLIYVSVPCQGVQSTIVDLTSEVRCSGLEVQFHNTSIGTDNFHWDFGVPGITSDTSNLATPTYTFPAEGQYDITLVSQPGSLCSDTAIMTYTLYLPRTVMFEAEQVYCADGSPLELAAVGHFADQAVFQWTAPGGLIDDPAIRTPSIQFADTGTYSITVHLEEFGCEDEHTATVRLVAPPKAGFATTDPAGCAPWTVGFVDTTLFMGELGYEWTFGDGQVSNQVNPLHTYSAAGSYDVRLVVGGISGCTTKDTLAMEALVTVHPVPVAAMLANPGRMTLLDPTTTVTDLSIGGDGVVVSIGGSTYTDSVLVHRFNGAGWHTVRLLSYTEEGCVDSTSAEVFVEGHLVYAPTAFTPNGDGVNEVWGVSVTGARNFRLDIFDRWGRLRYTTDDPQAGWDGSGADPGLYNYTLWLSEHGTNEAEYRGHFHLLR